MSEFGENDPRPESPEPKPFISNEYDGSYSKNLSLNQNIVDLIHSCVGDVANPLIIREGGLRFRNYEDREEYTPYRLTKFGQSGLLLINSAIIDEMVKKEEDEKLGHLPDRYKEEERHEMLFTELFAKAVQAGVYDWAKKELNENLKRNRAGVLTRVKKNRDFDKFWGKKKNNLVMLSFFEIEKVSNT